jgi:phytoene dehydrogenase-like protein
MAADVDIAVVGAGHNGLVAATYLARAGLRVSLFERRPFPGGACITEELWPGFKFSTCAHMTHGLHPRIIRDLDLYGRGMEVIPRPFNLYPLPNGSYWAPATHESPRNRASHLTAEERDGQRRYGEFVRLLRATFAPYRLQVPPSLDEVRANVARTPAAAVLETALTARVWDVHDELLPSMQLRDRQAGARSSVGRNPLALALAFSSLDDVDEETGEKPPHGYVRGGMGVVTRLVADAAQEAGATIHVDHGVAGFLVEHGRVIGVRLENGTEVRSRIVLSNLDPKRTFLRMLEPEHVDARLRRRIEQLITQVSCYKLLGVVSELPQWKDWDGDMEEPARGVVVLGASRGEIAAAYDELEAGLPTRAPTISFSLPSGADPSLARPGYHTVSCYIYPAAGRLRRGTWDDVRADIAEGLIDQITQYAPNFRRSLLQYKLRTPLDLERENGLTDGCIWHIQHEADQLFWNRPLPELANYRAPLPGLYLCGAGQHPGGEISGVPGHNAAQEALKDLHLV